LAPFLQPAAAEVSPPSGKLLTIREVAGQLGIGYSKTHELVTRGEIASISIERSRRVSPQALAEFITRSTDEPANVGSATPARRTPDRRTSQPAIRRPAIPSPGRSQSPLPSPAPRKTPPALDLSPKPETSAAPRFSEQELLKFVADLKKHGWPDDLAELIGADHRQRVTRTYAVSINDAAAYLGITRYAIGKLVDAGKLRQFVIQPIYSGQKPTFRIRADDVVALK
jgi:excisionase family DNA binding protein